MRKQNCTQNSKHPNAYTFIGQIHRNTVQITKQNACVTSRGRLSKTMQGHVTQSFGCFKRPESNQPNILARKKWNSIITLKNTTAQKTAFPAWNGSRFLCLCRFLQNNFEGTIFSKKLHNFRRYARTTRLFHSNVSKYKFCHIACYRKHAISYLLYFSGTFS